MTVRLWLDDLRPAPEGFTWCRTVEEAKAVLLAGGVLEASFDHDLDLCPICRGEGAAPCPHDTTGYDLVRWLVEEAEANGRNLWPATKPRVHSANPVGATAMRQMIERYWRAP